MFPKSLALSAVALLLSACASTSADVTPAEIEAAQFERFGCEQLEHERYRVHAQMVHLAGEIDRRSVGDRIAMGVGVVLFWPALFLIDGEGPRHDELARLKGEEQQLRDTMASRDCDAAPRMRAGDPTPASKAARRTDQALHNPTEERARLRRVSLEPRTDADTGHPAGPR